MAKPIAGLTAAARAAGMPKGGYLPLGIVRTIVGAQHVGTSALTIARGFWHKRARQYPRPLKRAMVRAALRAHADNRALYRDVMRGSL